MFEMAKRVTQRLASGSVETELRQIDDGFFAELDERQAEVRVACSESFLIS
jgi:hypothetical protein